MHMTRLPAAAIVGLLAAHPHHNLDAHIGALAVHRR